jgi:hypothetical protein
MQVQNNLTNTTTTNNNTRQLQLSGPICSAAAVTRRLHQPPAPEQNYARMVQFFMHDADHDNGIDGDVDAQDHEALLASRHTYLGPLPITDPTMALGRFSWDLLDVLNSAPSILLHPLQTAPSAAAAPVRAIASAPTGCVTTGTPSGDACTQARAATAPANASHVPADVMAILAGLPDLDEVGCILGQGKAFLRT